MVKYKNAIIDIIYMSDNFQLLGTIEYGGIQFRKLVNIRQVAQVNHKTYYGLFGKIKKEEESYVYDYESKKAEKELLEELKTIVDCFELLIKKQNAILTKPDKIDLIINNL